MKSLIIYFSRADENYSVGFVEKGNTEVIAEYIKELTGSDIFKVEPGIPYATDYETCIKEAKERTENHDAPIKESIPDISSYDIIYIGSPIYWGGMPEEMFTALNNHDFTGKTIKPFTTHEGSFLSSVPNQLKSICVGATINEGLAIYGHEVKTAKDKVEAWLNK